MVIDRMMRYFFRFLVIGFFICNCNISEAIPPVIGTITLFWDDDGGATTPTTQMTPNDEMTLVVEVGYELGFDWIYGANFYIWNFKTTTEDGTDTHTDHATYQWSNDLGWRLLGPLSSTWTIDEVHCTVGTITHSTGTLKLVFTPGKISRYEQDKNWKITVDVKYYNQYEDCKNKLDVSNTFYSEIDIENKEGIFNSNFAGTDDNPLTYPINLNIIANGTYNLQIKAEDFIHNDGTHTIKVNNLSYKLNEGATQTLSYNFCTIGTYSITSEYGSTKTVYLWLDYPIQIPFGTYTSQLYLKVTPPGTTTLGTETVINLYAYIKPTLGYLEFKSAPTQGIAGTDTTFIIQRKDTANEIMLQGTTTINLSGIGTFTPNPVIIVDGTSTAEFYYYQEKAGSWTITASYKSITANTTILIEPAEIDHLTFITIPATITIKTISPVFRVQRQDVFNNPVTKGTLSLRGLSDSYTEIFLPEFITIKDGTSIAEFYYYDESYGSPTIRISAIVANQDIKAAEAKIQVLMPPPYVEFTAENIPTEHQFPGSTHTLILKIFVKNFYSSTKTITSVKLTNATKGSGYQSDLDSQISKLYLYHNSTHLGSSTFISGTATFDNLCISIPAWGSTTLSIFYDLSLKNAKDGDKIDMQIENITFSTTTTISANFPLNSYGYHIVDGMVSEQIRLINVPTANFKADKLNNLVLDIIIPPNGYATDTLTEINIENSGTADKNDILLKLWVNDKNLDFSTTTAAFLGTLSFTGKYWQKSGINYPIGTAGLRTFITADIKEAAKEGKTIKLKIPINGIEVASGNDGPIDLPIKNKSNQYIKVHNKVIFEALDLLKEKVNPADKELDILSLAITNYYTQIPQTLTKLIITNTTHGIGTITELDSEIATLYLYEGTNTLIKSSNYIGGKAIFSLNLPILPQQTKYLMVKYDLSLRNAKDRDIINCCIKDKLDIEFKGNTTAIGGIFPLDSFGFHEIDGLVNHQVINFGAKATTAGVGSTDVLLLDLLIPSNGYATDTLTKMRIKNSGTAKNLDLKLLKLWLDDTNGIFGTKTDILIGTFSWISELEEWLWIGTITISPPGKRIFISADIADNVGATIMMKLPINGLEFLSDNDGPIDSEIINPYMQIISKDILSSLKLSTYKTAINSTITVIMEVKNTSMQEVHTITPTVLSLQGSGSASLITSPNPHPLLPPGSSTKFIWTYKVLNIPGTLSFSGYATSTTLSSTKTASALLYIQDIPKKLKVYHIPNMRFEVNKGQKDILAMSIIFENPATSFLVGDIKIGTLTLNTGTIPNLAIDKISLLGAGIVYGSKTDIEDSGTNITLPLKTHITIPADEKVKVDLIIDIPQGTTTDIFQISLAATQSITAYDANSKVKIETIEADFPLESGYTNIKTQSQGIIANIISVSKFANIGQKNLLSLQIEFSNPGEDVSKVEVTQFTLTINNGTISPKDIISNIMIKEGANIYGSQIVTEQNPVIMILSSAITLGNVDRVVDIVVDISKEPLYDELQIGSISIVARDSNTAKEIPVNFGSISISSIKLQNRAKNAIVIGTATIPAKIYQGQKAINVFELKIAHSGTGNTASILLKEVKLNIPQAVSKIMIGDGLGTYFVTGTQNLALTIPAVISPQSTISINFRIDLKAEATLGKFKLDLLDVKVIDANDFSTITDAFLPISAISQIKEKPTGLLVKFESKIPVNVAKGDKNIHVLTLTFTNQGGTETDEINVGTITISISDKAGNPIFANHLLSKIILSYDGTQTIKTDIPASSQIPINLVQKLKVGVDKSKIMEIKVDISSVAEIHNFKISLIDVKAYDNWDNLVDISGKFPMESQSSIIFSPALETSFTNYPNPFAAGRESTTIAYYLPEDGYVTIKIYTVIGDLVITLLNNVFKSKGMHQEDKWDGRNGIGEVVLNGVYFCQIKVNYITGASEKKVRKIAVVR